MCAYHCALLEYTIQHRTVLTIFPLILQTITIAQMLSTEVEGCPRSRNYLLDSSFLNKTDSKEMGIASFMLLANASIHSAATDSTYTAASLLDLLTTRVKTL